MRNRVDNESKFITKIQNEIVKIKQEPERRLSGAASEAAVPGRGAEEAPCAGPNTASVSR